MPEASNRRGVPKVPAATITSSRARITARRVWQCSAGVKEESSVDDEEDRNVEMEQRKRDEERTPLDMLHLDEESDPDLSG